MAVDSNLASYVSQRRAQGASDTNIVQELQGAGWDKATIADAVKLATPSVSDAPLFSSVRVVNKLDTVPHRLHKWLWILVALILLAVSAGALFAYGQYKKYLPQSVMTNVASTTTLAGQVADKAQQEMLSAIAKAEQSDFACADKQVTLASIDNAVAQDTTTEGLNLLRDDVVAEYAHACPAEVVPVATTSVMTTAEAKKIYTQIASSEKLSASSTVLFWPKTLSNKDDVRPYGGSSFKLGEGEYWFSYIDATPSAQFEHPVTYVFINKATGAYIISREVYYPVINGETLAVTHASGFSELVSNIGGLLGGSVAYAQSDTVAKRRAIIFIGASDQRGFFLDGDRMYKALKAQGYIDDDITYLAPESKWRGQGVDGDSGTTALKAAITDIASQTACSDEVLVFIASHGGWINVLTWSNRSTGQVVELGMGEYPYSLETPGESANWKIEKVEKRWNFLTKSPLSGDYLKSVGRLIKFGTAYGMTDKRLAELLTTIPSCHKTLVVDACVSGVGVANIIKQVPGLEAYAATDSQSIESASIESASPKNPTFGQLFGELTQGVIGNTGPGLFGSSFADALAKQKITDPARYQKAFTVAKDYTISKNLNQHPSESISQLPCRYMCQAQVATSTPPVATSSPATSTTPIAKSSGKVTDINWCSNVIKNQDLVDMVGASKMNTAILYGAPGGAAIDSLCSGTVVTEKFYSTITIGHCANEAVCRELFNAKGINTHMFLGNTLVPTDFGLGQSRYGETKIMGAPVMSSDALMLYHGYLIQIDISQSLDPKTYTTKLLQVIGHNLP